MNFVGLLADVQPSTKCACTITSYARYRSMMLLEEEEEEEEEEKNITLELIKLIDRINHLVSSLPTDLQHQQNVRQSICRAIFLSHSYKPNNKRSPQVLLPSPCVEELPAVNEESDSSVSVGAAPAPGAMEPVVEAQCIFIKARSEEGLGDCISSHHCTIDGGVLGVVIPATSRGRVLAAELETIEEAKVGTRSSTSDRRCGRIGASEDGNLTRSGDDCAAAITTAAAAAVRPVKTKNHHLREDVIRNVPGQSPDPHDCYNVEPPGHHNQAPDNDHAAAIITRMTTTAADAAAGRRGGGESVPSSNKGLSDDDDALPRHSMEEEAMMRDASPAARATTRRITGVMAAGVGSVRSVSSSSSSSLQYQESNFMAGTQTEEDEATEEESLDATTTGTDSERDGGWGQIGGDENQIDFQGLAAEAPRGTLYYHHVAAAVESGAEADDEKE